MDCQTMFHKNSLYPTRVYSKIIWKTLAFYKDSIYWEDMFIFGTGGAAVEKKRYYPDEYSIFGRISCYYAVDAP